jgi:hypothetical protein
MILIEIVNYLKDTIININSCMMQWRREFGSLSNGLISLEACEMLTVFAPLVLYAEHWILSEFLKRLLGKNTPSDKGLKVE